MNFEKWMQLCNDKYCVTEYLCKPINFLMLISSPLPPCHWHPGNFWSTFYHYSFIISRISYKWSHFSLAWCFWDSTMLLYLWVVCSFLLLNCIATLYGETTVHPFIRRTLGFLQSCILCIEPLWAFKYKFLIWKYSFASHESVHRSGMAGTYDNVHLI